MAKVQIKNERITPFGGIYFVTVQFKPIERAIDGYLGRRCMSVGCQYGEIVRAMMCNFFCAGDRTEDINIIKERVGYGTDTVLRMHSLQNSANAVYTSESGNEYRGFKGYVNTKKGLHHKFLYYRDSDQYERYTI